MELSKKQVEQLSKYISILDVKSYIETHLQEYNEFLKEEEKNKNGHSA